MFTCLILLLCVLMNPSLYTRYSVPSISPPIHDIIFEDSSETCIPLGFRKFSDRDPQIIFLEDSTESVFKFSMDIHYDSGVTSMEFPIIHNSFNVPPALLGYIINADSVGYIIATPNIRYNNTLTPDELRALQEFFLFLTLQ